MSSTRSLGFCLLFALTLLTVTPSTAHAQWYFQGYLGGNHTHSADIHIVQSSSGVDLTYAQVPFEAKPLAAPPYYGYRFGRLGKERRLGLEFEFTHLKVIAETTVPVSVTGQAGTAAISRTEPMDIRIERYSMTHGLNFFLANLVSRTPLGRGPADRSPAAFIARVGVGATLPHAESFIAGIDREQYEWAGMGAQGAAGVDLHVYGFLSAFVEYKLAFAKPTITITGGTGQTTIVTHEVAIGFGIALSRPR